MQMDINMYTLESSGTDTQDLSLNNPVNDMTEFQNIQNDIDGVVSGSKPPNEKYDSKCATFPCSSKTTSSAETCLEVAVVTNDIIVQKSTHHDKIQSADPNCSRSSSLPTISAMKGSREKRGVTPPQKLTVKWDPDVYDPVPTSVSHSVPDNKPQRKSKKNSKSKQKNGSKSSRGNKYKDKLAGKRGGG